MCHLITANETDVLPGVMEIELVVHTCHLITSNEAVVLSGVIGQFVGIVTWLYTCLGVFCNLKKVRIIQLTILNIVLL